MPETQSNGILKNHSNRIDATEARGSDAHIVYDNKYTGGEGVGCLVPGGEVFDKTFNPRDLEGYYNIRVFHDTDTVLDPYTWVCNFEVYKDGEKVVFDAGDHVNGELKLDYMDQTRVLGSRIVFWFDPDSEYRIIIRTSTTLSGYNFILDYLQFDKISHSNPLVNWINASEIEGGNLWVMDMGADSVTGSGTPYNYVDVYPWYPFTDGDNLFASAMPENVNINSTYGTLQSDGSIRFYFKHTDNTNWSSTINFKWFAMGSMELPIIRPL